MNTATSYAAVVGLDWEQTAHALCLWPTGAASPEASRLPHTPAAIAAWAADLRARFGGQPIAVCLEQSRGSLVSVLRQYDFLVLFPLNPKQLADYRSAVAPSGAKSDPFDAELLARFWREHHAQFPAGRPADPVSRALQLLAEQRRKWVEDRVALGHQLRSLLAATYPLALELLRTGAIESDWFLSLLEAFPAQRELQRASPRRLARVLPTVSRHVEESSAEELQAARVQRIRDALPMTTDAAELEHSRLAIKHLVIQLRALLAAIAECEERQAARFAEHPDHELFASFPGAGAALAPRLAAAYGTDRTRFPTARDMQQLSGVAPVTKASGKTRVVHLRWACPKFLRQTFHEFASCSVKFSKWAQAFVAERKSRGERYQTILRALAFKWQRILHRCWQTGELYDEERYLAQLRKKGAKFLAYLPPKPEPTT